MTKKRTKAKTAKPSAEAAANVAALMNTDPNVDPSEAEFAAEEAEAAEAAPELGDGEHAHVEAKKAQPGSWADAQKPLEKKPASYRLVTIAKPRKVLHAEVPSSVVKFTHDDEGKRVLVFDGRKCPRGVITYQGVRCYLDGGPEASPDARELSAIRARLAELEARPIGQFAEAEQ